MLDPSGCRIADIQGEMEMTKSSVKLVDRTEYYSSLFSNVLRKNCVIRHLSFHSPMAAGKPHRFVPSEEYRCIAKLFSEGRIPVYEYNDLESDRLAAYSPVGQSMIKVNKHAFDKEPVGTIVHETTHIIHDYRKLPLSNWEGELEAFFASMLLYYGQGQDPKCLDDLHLSVYKIAKRYRKRGVKYFDSNDFHRKRRRVRQHLLERYSEKYLGTYGSRDGLKLRDRFEDL